MLRSRLTVLLGLLLPCLALSFSSESNVVGFGNRITPATSTSCKRRTSVRPTTIFSTAIPQQDEEKVTLPKLYECQGCNRVFDSRNALFRHLRGEDETAIDCPLASGSMAAAEEELLMVTVVRYGYLSGDQKGEEGNMGANDIVANLIHEAFVHHMNAFFDGDVDASEHTISTSALTYSTATKNRQPSLRQDEEVIGATSEVLSFNYRLMSKPPTVTKWKEYATSDQLLEQIQAWLDDKDNCQIKIQLHHMDALVPRSSQFYAERSCSQSSYRYLLPIKWILPGIMESDDDTSRAEALSQVEEWWKHINVLAASHQKHQPRNQSPALPPFIKQLKKSLKAVESQTEPNRRIKRQAERENEDQESGTDASDMPSGTTGDDSPIRLSHGRFGQLWRKRRICWSNFAHSKLSGMAASPVHEAVWRTMDRATIVGFMELQDSSADRGPVARALINDVLTREQKDQSKGSETMIENMHIILEFRADGFVVGQLPSIISSLVAMTNGWLPQNFFEIVTRPDVYMPAPLAPPLLDKRQYFQSARFHFHELITNGIINNFEKTVRPGSQSEQSWEAELHNKLLGGLPLDSSNVEMDWLLELRDNISPDLCRQIEVIENETQESQSSDGTEESSKELPLVETDAPAGAYAATLDLLRTVVNGGKWPTTSDARSRVIKTPGGGSSVLATKKKKLVSKFPGSSISSGSFTVVNDDIWDSDSLPLANELFPDLTRSVFDLEKEIIELTNPPLPAADGIERQPFIRRSPSTHCAVNRNAQFTPHVDSGRGQGQRMSMIVGLGNYTGGETLVEGKPYGIRYNPLEFDGWNQLHWTATFKGERYSLVWFTPETSHKNTNENESVTELGEKLASADDLHADRLAQEHSKTVPFLPPLNFRPDSTDALVINELLDLENGSAYTMKPNVNMPSGFSLKNHKVVLDVGAHIGVFSRYAIAEGCERIISYEPEPSNFELLAQNLDIESRLDAKSQPTIELHSSAVSDKSSESRTLVKARNENSGKENTWRHSLEEHSQYVDRSTKMSSESQKQTLDRFSVPCVSFFGENNGEQEGALVAGVTFVKLDCEGAEINILLSDDASQQSSWLDTTHLVVEWSFTKERSVKVFHEAMDNLREAGFEVFYEGIGSWWDTDAGVIWPYPNDLIIFAIMNE